MIDYDNKLKPFPKKQITNYNSFINPFEKNDSSLANKTFEEVRELFKKDLNVDLLDAANEPDTDTSYRGKAWKHYAPDPSVLIDPVAADWEKQVAPLTDPSKILSNVYDRSPDEIEGEYYEHGTDGRDFYEYEMDQYTHQVYQAAKNNPETEITVYRVMPKNKRVINTGDWVTFNLQYALAMYDLIIDQAKDSKRYKKYHIVTKKVKAKDLWVANRDDTDDWHSAGYYPQK
jgi:hypothetical protein